jgi:putative ABC transport system permease protein
MLLNLAWQSLKERRGSVLLTLAALTLCVVMVLGVEHVRSQAREVFTRTISGTDLIVGARTSQLNLLLYSIFRISAPANNVNYESYEHWQDDARVAWTIPFSMGDSHHGYAVIATNENFFAHFHYGSKQALSFAEGGIFAQTQDAVLGYQVAKKLGYSLGTSLVLAHGTAVVSFHNHDNSPFTVVGMLAPTGTPVDQAIYIQLDAQAALHAQEGEAPAHTEAANEHAPADEAGSEHAHADHDHDHAEDTAATHEHAEPPLTAFLVGLTSRAAVFGLQREINDFAPEALTAILPGVALAELWQALSKVEAVLSLLSGLVMLASLLGLATMLLASMQNRRREMALYRALGARPWMILTLIELEALLLVLAACGLGCCLVCAGLALGQDSLLTEYGIAISLWPFTPVIGLYLIVIVVAAMLLALIPALSAYRAALSSELTSGR